MKVLMLAALLVIAGCGRRAGGHSDEPAHEAVPFGAATEYVMPYSTAQDWVTYADHVVIVTVTADLRPLSDLPPEEGGYIVGAVTIRVEQVLWSRPQAPPLPTTSTFEIQAGGWIQYDSGRGRTSACDYACPERGHRYVIGLGHSNGTWYPFGAGASVFYDNGRIGGGGREQRDQFPELIDSLWERPASALQQRLEHTEPDPYAVKYMHLDNVGERYQRAHVDRRLAGH